MATIKAIFRDKDSKIYIQYGHNSKTVLFKTGIKTVAKNWNDNKQAIDSTRNVKKIKANEELIKALEKEDNISNANINLIKSNVNAIVRNMTFNQVDPTTDKVKTEYEKEENIPTVEDTEFIPLFKKFVSDSETGQRLTKKGKRIKPLTIKSYNQNLTLFEDFAKEKKFKLVWKNINDQFYFQFCDYLWNNLDYYDNAVGSRIRVLITFLNWCLDKGYITKKIQNANWIVWEEEIDIVVLYPDELSILFNTKAEDTRIEELKDRFLSGCMTCLRVSNLLGLRKEELTGNQLKVISVKGDKQIYLDVNPLLMGIFKKYEGKYPTLLPPISEQKFNDGLKDLARWLKKHMAENKMKEGFIGNDWNKQFLRTRYKQGEPIRTKVKFEEMISSHTMRRTGITNLLMMGLSEIEVKSISGHSLNSNDFSKYVKIAEQFISKKSNEAWGKIAFNSEPVLKVAR